MFHDQGDAGPTGSGHGGDLMAEVSPELEEQAGFWLDCRLSMEGHERGVEEQSPALQIVGNIEVEDSDFDREGGEFRSGPGIEASIHMRGHMSTLGNAKGVDEEGVGAVRCGLL